MPLFAFGNDNGDVSTSTIKSSGCVCDIWWVPKDSTSYYAQVQPVPAPLPIFGVAAAFSCAQRFRRNSKKLSMLAKKNFPNDFANLEQPVSVRHPFA